MYKLQYYYFRFDLKKKVESKDKSSVISGAFPLEAIMLGKHIVTYIDKKCMINHPKTKGIVLYF